MRKQSEPGACRTRPVVSFPEESKSIRQPLCKADPYGVLLILIACEECLATTTSDTEADDNLSHTRIRYRVDDYLVNCLKISTERPLLPERIRFRRMHALDKVRCHATAPASPCVADKDIVGCCKVSLDTHGAGISSQTLIFGGGEGTHHVHVVKTVYLSENMILSHHVKFLWQTGHPITGTPIRIDLWTFFVLSVPFAGKNCQHSLVTGCLCIEWSSGSADCKC